VLVWQAAKKCGAQSEEELAVCSERFEGVSEGGQHSWAAARVGIACRQAMEVWLE
jgi:hypothetical protein